MTYRVSEDFFKKDQEQIGEYILGNIVFYKSASKAADQVMREDVWSTFRDYPKNESTLSDSLQARKDELAARARGGDKFAAALVEERERTGTERGYEGEPA
jgi:hypothetical protein